MYLVVQRISICIKIVNSSPLLNLLLSHIKTPWSQALTASALCTISVVSYSVTNSFFLSIDTDGQTEALFRHYTLILVTHLFFSSEKFRGGGKTCGLGGAMPPLATPWLRVCVWCRQLTQQSGGAQLLSIVDHQLLQYFGLYHTRSAHSRTICCSLCVFLSKTSFLYRYQ